MKKIEIHTSLEVYNSIDELPDSIQKLMNAAIEVRKNAYAPYSKFRVGAALLLDNNEIVVGSNQENAAYPSGLCAERVAIFHSGSVYPNANIVTLVITASSDVTETNTPIPPCGACRQAIVEYEFKQDAPIEIYFMGAKGEVYKSNSIKDLLPLTFDKKFL